MRGLQTHPEKKPPETAFSETESVPTGSGLYATSAAAPAIDLTPPITGIRVGAARDALVVTFESGNSQALPAGFLWQECRSAAGIMRRLSGEAAHPPAGLTILRLAPVGDYAINIVFSDGHHRGIFPWRFLQELAARCRASIQE